MNERLRVLFVDDSEDDVALIVRELSNAWRTTAYQRVDEPEALASAIGQPWDVVLCDYVMPGFSGLEALKLIKEKDPDLPCIVVSGQIGEEEAVKAMKAGASDYIMKDKLRRLAPAIQREINEARLRLEKQRIQATLQAREEELHFERLVVRSKDEFIGFVSHELRTPLTVIIGSLRTILATKGMLSDEEETQLLKDAATEAEGLSDVIENLLHLARIQANRLDTKQETGHPSQMVEDVLKKVEARASGHRFTLTCPASIRVKGDPSKIRVILNNLLVNAVKYSPPGEVCVSVGRKSDMAVFAVSDRGVGISEKELKSLFQPFERVGASRESTGGIGLGLMVSKRLVEAQGGRIWVESKPGEGSTFYFELPLASNSDSIANT